MISRIIKVNAILAQDYSHKDLPRRMWIFETSDDRYFDNLELIKNNSDWKDIKLFENVEFCIPNDLLHKNPLRNKTAAKYF